MKTESLEREWISSKEFTYEFNFVLKVFFQKEGGNVCLNVIKNWDNIGKFYCSEETFELALQNKSSIKLTDAVGNTFTAIPCEYQILEVTVLKHDLFRVLNRGGEKA